MKILAALTLALASLGAQAAYVDSVTGRTWRDLTETTNLSWSTAAESCDATTGLCSLPVNGVAGLTWASTADVRALFQNMGIFGPVGVDSWVAMNSTWAPAAIDRDGNGPDVGQFMATMVSGDFSMVAGIARDGYPNGANWPSIQDFGPNALDFAIVLDGLRPKGDAHPWFGIWMFSEAAAEVPEPLSTTLTVTGLVALAWSRRRSQRRHQ